MKKTFRRIQCLLLAAVMAFSLLPVITTRAEAANDMLNPPSETVNIGGKDIAVLSKTATRTAPDKWQVTLGVESLLGIQRNTLYIEFCLDVSRSMTTSMSGGTRLSGLQSALEDMLKKLKSADADIRFHITKFDADAKTYRDWTDLSTLSETDIHNIAYGLQTGKGTNISGALAKSYSALEKVSGTKVLVFMGDGAPEANCHPTSSENSYPSRFWASGITTYGVVLGSTEFSTGDMFIRSICGDPKYDSSGKLINNFKDGAYYAADGLTDYTNSASEYYVAASYRGTGINSVCTADSGEHEYFYFVTSNSKKADNRFKYNIENYFSASNTATLSASFQEIAEKAVAMVIDPAGTGFGEATVISVNGQYFTADDIVTWTPEVSSLNSGESYQIVYTVKLDPTTLDVNTTNKGVFTMQPLNGNALLKFSYNNTAYSQLFPLPKADFEVAELTVKYHYETSPGVYQIASDTERYVIVDFKDPTTNAFPTFTFTVPSEVAVKNLGLKTLAPSSCTYQVNGETKAYADYPLKEGNGATVAGVHVLDLWYQSTTTNSHSVSLTVGSGGTAKISSVSAGGTIPNETQAYVLDGGYATIPIKPMNGMMIDTANSKLESGTLSDPDAAGVYTLSLSNIHENKAVKVVFKEAKAHTVTAESADVNTGTVSPASAKVYTGRSTSFTAKPKAGYVIYKVDLDKQNATYQIVGNQINVSNVTGDVKATVSFKKAQYDVTYLPGTDASVSGTVDAQKKNLGVSLNLRSTTFERFGYTQTGWATTEGGSKAYGLGGSYTTDADLILYPVWTANSYNITYNLDGGTNANSNPATYTYGTGVASFADASKNGMSFAGWYDAPSGGNLVTNIPQTATGSKTLYARWTANSYNITYNLDGGTNANSNPATYTYGTGVASFADASKNGSTFAGWYDAPSGGNLVTNIPQTETGDKTLYARWTAAEFRVTLHGNGGSGTPLNGYTSGTGAKLPTDWTKPNATFLGWYETPDFKGNPITEIPAGSTGDREFYAKWQLKAIYDTFEEIGGEPSGLDEVILTTGDDVIVIYGVPQAQDPENWTKDAPDQYHMTLNDSVRVPAPDKRTNYQFAGWDVTDASGTVTFVAQWLKTEMEVPAGMKDQIVEIGSGLMDYAKRALEKQNESMSASDNDRIQEMEVVLSVEAYTTEEVESADAEESLKKIVSIADGRTLIAYEITIESSVTVLTWDGTKWTSNKEDPIPVTDTGSPITIRVPFDYTGRTDVRAYRYHDGSDAETNGAKEFSSAKNKLGECCEEVRDENALDIHAQLFSTYAIGYRSMVIPRPAPVKPAEEKIYPALPEETGVIRNLITDDHIVYVIGYPEGDVRPQGNITRAEAAMMFYRLLKVQTCDQPGSFTDVADHAWYADAVRTLAGRGIINGYPDGSFAPDRAITRAEFIAMAMRFADEAESDVVFTDVEITHWAYADIVSAAAYRWVDGYPDGSFKPDDAITRAEVCTIVNNMLDRRADETFVAKNFDKLVQFSDLKNKKAWYFYQMVEATCAHEFTRDGREEIWN